jgi:hypothetical protein
MTINPNKLLGDPVTSEYTPRYYGGLFQYIMERPWFQYDVVDEMICDPRIVFGLWLIKGPILQQSRFFIDTEDERLKDYLVKIVTRFWRSSASRALKAIEWGFSGSEVLYKIEEGQLVFDVLKDLHSRDCRAVTKKGKLVGILVHNAGRSKGVRTITASNRLFLGGPKALWHIHQRELDPWYGRSRLYGAYIPWWEQWSQGGYRDSRRLWFQKNAFEGGVIYHPPGISRDESNNVVNNKEVARDLIRRKRTGGYLTFPNSTIEGQPEWRYEPPAGNPTPTGLLEYGDSLRDETWEGMGIPAEIARAEGTGSFAGRRVPHQAFFATLQELVQWLMHDFTQQVAEELVRINIPGAKQFEIVPFGLLRDNEQLEAQEGMDQMQGGSPLPPGSEGAQFGFSPNQLCYHFQEVFGDSEAVAKNNGTQVAGKTYNKGDVISKGDLSRFSVEDIIQVTS